MKFLGTNEVPQKQKDFRGSAWIKQQWLNDILTKILDILTRLFSIVMSYNIMATQLAKLKLKYSILIEQFIEAAKISLKQSIVELMISYSSTHHVFVVNDTFLRKNVLCIRCETNQKRGRRISVFISRECEIHYLHHRKYGH